MPRSSLVVVYALVAAVVVLVLSGIIGWRAAQSATEASEAIARNKDTLLSLERTLSAVRDAETGERGYLLTGNESYLQPYTRAIADLSARVSQLRAGVYNDPATRQQLDELQRLISAKMEEIANTLQLQRSGNHQAALQLVLTDEGRRLMEQIATRISGIEATQSAVFENQLGRLRRARVRAAASIIAVRLLTIALVITLVLVVRRDTSRARLSEERLAITLQSIGDAVIATDPDGRIVTLNTVAEALTGWSGADAHGQSLDQVFRIVSEHTHSAVEGPVARVLREGRVVGVGNHALLVARNGTQIPIEDSAAPIRDAGGNLVGVVLVFRDASAERQVARTLLEADQKKDEFIAVLAHELRNPLAPILQAVQIARSPRVRPEQLRWCLDIIDRQGRTMGRLLDDLLDVTRITRGTVQVAKSRVVLADVVNGAVETSRPAIEERKQSLVLNLPSEPVTIEVDPLRISQVIANLLTNAAKYTDPGGVIRLTASQQGKELTLSVSDTGVGIDPQVLPRVFDMFVQVKGAALHRVEGGLGIGLAVSKKLVELHDGTIEARSEGLGRGSEFVVRMPCVVESSASALTTSASVPTLGSNGKAPRLRVVIADDNRDAAESLAMLLRMDGHQISLAHDGVQALSMIKQLRPHAAVLDIGMPGMNGYQVAEQVRADPLSSQTMLIALTGWGQAQDLERAQAAGFDHHLVKPAGPSAVRALLRRQ
jgi:PAS domain S-box-containing protein